MFDNFEVDNHLIQAFNTDENGLRKIEVTLPSCQLTLIKVGSNVTIEFCIGKNVHNMNCKRLVLDMSKHGSCKSDVSISLMEVIDYYETDIRCDSVAKKNVEFLKCLAGFIVDNVVNDADCNGSKIDNVVNTILLCSSKTNFDMSSNIKFTNIDGLLPFNKD
jgi:hypothetical protein